MTEQTLAKREIGEVTQKGAAYLIKTLWPQATDDAILKAALICHQYRLSPLIKQVFLVPFKRKTGETTWEAILGIKATRAIVQRKHSYSFVDGPRVMTEPEQIATFGQVEPDKIWAIVKLCENGNVFPGYGSYSRAEQPHGSDKGNSALNMAFIRAERNALDKMAPGELPDDVDVSEERSITLDAKVLAEGKKEFIQGTERDVDALWPEAYEPPPVDKVDTAWVSDAISRLHLNVAKLHGWGYKIPENERLSSYLNRIDADTRAQMVRRIQDELDKLDP